MLNNEIKEKAEILANAIVQSSELAELRKAEEAMTADESAQLLVGELQVAYERFMESQQSGGLADKTQVGEIEVKMDANPTIVAYMTAQDNYREMMQSVNAILAGTIAGPSRDGCSCTDDSCDSSTCEASGCDSGGCGCF